MEVINSKSCTVGCQTVTRGESGVILSSGRYIPFGKEDFDPYLTYLGEEYVGEVGERLEKIGVRIELFKEESSKFVLYPIK